MTAIADLQKIIDPNDYSWIRVKRYIKDETKSAAEQLADLEQHHLKETTFLLNKCRQLAQEVLDLRDYNE